MPVAGGIPFGNYLLLRRLARGGMAEVFLATQKGPEGFERQIAIKRILPHLVDAQDFVEMFMDEARLATRLVHPNVAHIYEFGKAGEYYFIAMEYVDGLTAADLCRSARENPVPLEHAIRIAADTCAGLHYAHGNGVVHRDVSPQNILVSFDGAVKLVDFGIAKAAHQMNRTRPGVIKGKYAYMSPEQVEGRTLDGRSDVFNMGIVLYELVTGVPLFRRDDAMQAMKQIRSGKLVPPEQHRPDVPPSLSRVVCKALAADRDQRYETCAEMQLELERVLQATGRISTSALLAEFVRSRRSAAQQAGNEVADESGTRPATPGARRAAGEESSGTIRIDEQPMEEPPTVSLGRTDPPATALITGRRRRTIGMAAAAMIAMAGGVAAAVVLARPAAAPVAEALPPPAPKPAAPVVVPAQAPAPAPEPAPPPAPEKPVKAHLTVISSPAGAAVNVDGHNLGRAPVRNANLSAGPHTVTLTLAGHQKKERAIRLAAGDNQTLELDLPKVGPAPAPRTPPGYLTVRTIPWARVYDGPRLVGTTPLANQALAAGPHKLAFVTEDGKRTERQIDIASGEVTKLQLDLK